MSGLGTIPPEAWDHTHPDHDWWVEGAGQCFDQACPRHPDDHHAQGDVRLRDHDQCLCGADLGPPWDSTPHRRGSRGCRLAAQNDTEVP